MGITCSAAAADVLKFLEAGAGLSYRARPAAGMSNTVILSTGAPPFSEGETIEVSVIAQSKGCEVLFRGARVHPLSETADPKGATVRVVRAIADRFGPVTQLG
jgi:hypothetical protein